MRSFHSCLITVLVPVIVPACVPDEVAHDRLAKPVDVPLFSYIGRLLTVEVTVGVDTARLIFDTGGGETVLSPAIAERLGCTSSGRSVGYRMSGERIDFTYCPNVTLVIDGVRFPHEQIGIWDVQALLPEGVPPVDGVLSLKTLADQPFTLRLAEQRLTLETRESFDRQVETMSRLHSRIATGTDGAELTVFVRGTVDHAAWFLLDSGNLDVVQAGPHLRGEVDWNSEDTWEAELTLDGLHGVVTGFRTREIIYDGVLSEEFLRQWVLSFDLSANGIWASAVP